VIEMEDNLEKRVRTARQLCGRDLHNSQEAYSPV
jgi:hypothetical protein